MSEKTLKLIKTATRAAQLQAELGMTKEIGIARRRVVLPEGDLIIKVEQVGLKKGIPTYHVEPKADK